MRQIESSPFYRGWLVVLASMFGLAISPGPLVFGSLGIIASALESEFGWSRGDIMFTLTVFNISTLITAPLVGRLIDKTGARRVLLIFLVLFGASLTVPYFRLTHLFELYAIFFVAGAVSPGAQSMPYARLITSWFDQNRGLAIGIAAAGLGIGYAVIPLLTDMIVPLYGWRSAYLALGAMVFAVPFIFVLFFAFPKPVVDGKPHKNELVGLTASEAIRTRAFWVIAITILVFSCLLTGFVPHIVPLLRGRGIDGTLAAQFAAGFGVTTFLGRLLVGYLLDRFFAPHVAMVFFSISIVGFVVFLIGDSSMALFIATILVGAGFGAESDLIAYFISRYFGLKAFGQIYGYVLSAFILGAAIGPIALGYGYDYFGRYTEMLEVFVVAGICGTFLLLLLGAYTYPAIREDSAA